MVKTKRSSSIAKAALLLCFTLILSACLKRINCHEQRRNRSNSRIRHISTKVEATVAETATPATQTYTDSRGTITIPAHPQRIVDLTGSAIGNLLVLGVKP